MYLTRKGGASNFGQQVFVRLMNLQEEVPFWTGFEAAKEMDRDLTQSPAIGTLWDELYNLQNTESSFNISMAEADQVLCTDWDVFNIFAENGFNNLVIDSHTAPFVYPKTQDLEEKYIGCLPKK